MIVVVPAAAEVPFGVALDVLLAGSRSVTSTGPRFEVSDPDTLTPEQSAAIALLAAEHGGSVVDGEG